MIDVSKAPYSAKGDGLNDDTVAIENHLGDSEAIQKAIDSGATTVYLPRGGSHIAQAAAPSCWAAGRAFVYPQQETLARGG